MCLTYQFTPKLYTTSIVLLFLLNFIGCHSQDSRWLEEDMANAQFKRLKYNLQVPDRKMKLHNDLEEISGLAFVGPDRLACVQDELGRVFYYNLAKEKIEYNTKFAKTGDYEGIEVAGGNLYVNRNDGTLFRFPLNKKKLENADVEKIATPLSGKNDIEGLAYQPSSKKLLLACKGDSDVNNNSVKGKAIYAYDIEKNRLDPKPLFSIKKRDITRFIEKNAKNYLLSKSPDIKPSGIAIHPKTNDIYVVASVGKALLVFNAKGKIKDVAFLSKKLFKQPEGICFDPSGNLYIASEGVGGRGYILEFKYKR